MDGAGERMMSVQRLTVQRISYELEGGAGRIRRFLFRQIDIAHRVCTILEFRKYGRPVLRRGAAFQ
jgi:hypothetical protein